MGNTEEKLMNQILDLKVTSRLLERQARRSEKSSKSEKVKVKKAIEKNNVDGARIYAANSIRKRTEQLNYLRLSARLDAVVSRLQSHAAMSSIAKSMGNIVKSTTLSIGDLEQMSETMDRFEKQVVDMEVQAGFTESSMSGSAASISTWSPEGEVDSLMQQIAEEYGLEISVALPKAAARVVARQKEEVEDGDVDFTRRLKEEELKDKV